PDLRRAAHGPRSRGDPEDEGRDRGARRRGLRRGHQLAPPLAGGGGLPSGAHPPRRPQGDPREPRGDHGEPSGDGEGRVARGDLLQGDGRRVTGHLLKIQLWSFRNRIIARLKRLRQIRYLAATLVGIGYVCLVWRPWRMVRIVGPIPGSISPLELALPIEAAMGALLTAVALLRWLWPGSKPVLNFSEAEVAFLFPAPLTRRQLIRYSLIRS